MSYEIKKDVPMPDFTRGRAYKYPWAEMEIGDSIFLPSIETDRACSSYRNYARRMGNGVKFKRKQQGNEVGIWRVS